jgi:hypothetical protein
MNSLNASLFTQYILSYVKSQLSPRKGINQVIIICMIVNAVILANTLQNSIGNGMTGEDVFWGKYPRFVLDSLIRNLCPRWMCGHLHVRATYS